MAADFQLPIPFEVVQVEVAPVGAGPLTPKQRAAAQYVGRALRFGLLGSNRPLIEAAERLHQALFGAGPLRPRRIDAGPGARRHLEEIARDLERELLLGRLRVVRGGQPLVPFVAEVELTERRPEPQAELEEPPAPSKKPDTTTFFEVRLVDEIGQAIGGVAVELSVGTNTHDLTTNPAGVALLENVTAGSASVTIADLAALQRILEPRWANFRPGTAPSGANVRSVVFNGSDFGATNLKPAVPNTIVIKPPVVRLHVELLDKSGRVHHAGVAYTIEGPRSFAGKTDEQGRLRHDDVPRGDYTLKFQVGDQSLVSPIVALDGTQPEPQVRFLGVVPRVVMARIKGIAFETNKSFLLPDGAKSLAGIRRLYIDNEPSELLIVGHADTMAGPSTNDPLSLERAECTAAYLNDDVDAWLEMYETSTPAARRWGSREDQAMIAAMPDFAAKPAAQDPVRWFQETRGLEVDGDAGPKTRRQLITEYMNFDGTSLKQPRAFDINVTTHGCGENFPLDETGENLDPAPADQKEDGLDRRVEFFFFDAHFGIQPPPPGKNSPAGSSAYPEWRKQAVELVELDVPDRRELVLEWPDFLTADVPPDLVLRVKGQRTYELPWSSGTTRDGMRRFTVQSFDAPRATIHALGTDKELQLWNDQPIDDPEVPPTWEHLLEELLARTEPDPDTVEGGFPAVETAHASPNLD